MKTFLSILFLMNITSASWGANETFQDALNRLYPDCELKKEILYLTDEQKAKVNTLTGLKLRSQLANRYKKCDGGYVYIDSHIVRTLNQTVVVEVSEDQVKTFNVSAFLEPKEYKAPPKWLAQLASKKLDDLVLFTKVDGLSGATLTAKANVDAARRVLALDRVLDQKDEK